MRGRRLYQRISGEPAGGGTMAGRSPKEAPGMHTLSGGRAKVRQRRGNLLERLQGGGRRASTVVEDREADVRRRARCPASLVRREQGRGRLHEDGWAAGMGPGSVSRVIRRNFEGKGQL